MSTKPERLDTSLSASKKRPRTRKTIWHSRKKSRSENRKNRGSGEPTEKEWESMKRVGSFIVDAYEEVDMSSDQDDTDGDGSEGASMVTTQSGVKLKANSVTIRKGDDAILQSPTVGDGQAWVGQVKSIRVRPDSQDVWAYVLWYWSGTDLAGHIRSFESTHYSAYERACSDHGNLVSAHSFISATHVHEYDESAVEPPDLGPTDFFTRARLRFHKHLVEPKAGSQTCVCRRSYVLFPPAEPIVQQIRSATPKYAFTDQNGNMLLATQDEMHFCPRVGCRMWYHTACLMKHGFVDTQQSTTYRGDRAVRLLAVNPDSEVDCALLSWFSSPITDESEFDLTDTCQPLPDAPPLEPESLASALAGMSISYSTLAHLPRALVQIAQCPIVRRPGSSSQGWSAVGNIREVVLARRFVYAALEGGTPGGPWSQHLGSLIAQIEGFEQDEVLQTLQAKVDDCKDEPLLDDREDREIQLLEEACNTLSRYLLLASPYVPYWERRARELEEETWMHGPPVICPGCKGAI